MTNDDFKHTYVQALLQLREELGFVPNSQQFCEKVGITTGQLRHRVGNYRTLKNLAGVSEIDKPERRIDSTIFNKDISLHIDNYVPREIVKPYEVEPYPSAAIISDIHWPFVNQKVVDKFYEYVGDHKPKHVIINGDAWDFYSHTKFPRSHNVFTPKEEQDKAREMNVNFWTAIKSISPDSICTQMLGNHCVRPMKRILESYPEAEEWIKEKLKSLFTFDGVKTIFDPREELFLNSNVIVFHGYRGKLGDHRDYTLYSTINGHSHQGGVVFRKIRGSVLFELNSGYAGDPEAKGLTYTPQRITHWTPGFAVLDKYGPRFIHL